MVTTNVFYILQGLAVRWYGSYKKCFMFIYFNKLKKNRSTLCFKNTRLLSYSSPWKLQNWINFKAILILHKYSYSRNKDLTLIHWRTCSESLLSSKRNLIRVKICTFKLCWKVEIINVCQGVWETCNRSYKGHCKRSQ